MQYSSIQELFLDTVLSDQASQNQIDDMALSFDAGALATIDLIMGCNTEEEVIAVIEQIKTVNDKRMAQIKFSRVFTTSTSSTNVTNQV